jgi:hypothetical protein
MQISAAAAFMFLRPAIRSHTQLYTPATLIHRINMSSTASNRRTVAIDVVSDTV